VVDDDDDDDDDGDDDDDNKTVWPTWAVGALSLRGARRIRRWYRELAHTRGGA
jgi:hypothetical protein